MQITFTHLYFLPINQFIKILTNSTPAEMNEFIESKGKKGKSICPVIFHKNNNAGYYNDKL